MRFLAWTLTLAAAALLLGWLAGRLFTDRSAPTQYLYWMPTPAVVAASLAALVAAWALALAAARWPHRRRVSPRLLLAAAAAGTLAVGVHMPLREWHALRALQTTPARAAGSVRILFWNPAERLTDYAERVAHLEPRIVAIANPPWRVDTQPILDAVGERAFTARQGRLMIVAGYPILRHGWTELGVKGARVRVFTWDGGGNMTIDRGEALYAELDTRADLGRTTVVWVVDLPSDPDLLKDRIMREAAHTIRTFSGSRWVRGADDRAAPEAPDAPPGFPPADVIVGDFNTPRGSHSLTHITGELTHAFDQSGWGFAATWPRERPVFAIDHAFLASHLRAARFDVLDLGAGQHRALLVDVLAH